MKCFKLSAHDKPVTKVRFNREGDLLFVACKDKLITVWYTKTGKILGSYEASSAVYDLDVSPDSKYLVCGCGDASVHIFDVKTGQRLAYREVQSLGQVTCVKFDEDGKRFFCCTPYSKSSKESPGSKVQVFGFYPFKEKQSRIQLITSFDNNIDKVSLICGDWIEKNQILVGCSSGIVYKFIVRRSSDELALGGSAQIHAKEIKDLTVTPDKCFVISASLDNTAKLCDLVNMKVVKTFRSSEPINSVSKSPLKNHVVIGGGTRSQEVTTSYRKDDTFNPSFYHSIYEKEIAFVKGHFGPIHCVRFSPNGKCFASGGEDSIAKIYWLSQKYLNQKDSPESFLKDYVN